MKLMESYSRNAGVEIKYKPNLPSQYYPTPEKYITIQNSSNQEAKNFDLWQNIIDLIFPYLESVEIKIVQIGQGEIKPLNKVISLVNQTNFAQTIYLLDNALLHVGNDSFACHAAYKTPVIELFGSTNISCHSPYFYHEKSKFIESHRWGRNCSFNPGENPKSINLIDPFYVAAQILNILGINHNITQKSLLVGDAYFGGYDIHLIPDQILDPNAVAAGQIHLRADLFFDLNNIVNNLQRRKYVLWLDREIDTEILKQLKPNIEAIVFQVDDDVNIKFLKKIQRLGIGLNLFTKLSVDEHNKLKLSMLDLPLVGRHENVSLDSVKENIKRYLNRIEPPDLSSNKEYYFYSKRHYLSMGKIYSSLNSWKNQSPVENIEKESRADFTNQDFLNEIGYFLCFSKE